VAFVLAADGRTAVLFCLNCGTWYPSAAHDGDGELLDGTCAEDPVLVLPEVGYSVRFRRPVSHARRGAGVRVAE
jgi:hypothetical protein